MYLPQGVILTGPNGEQYELTCDFHVFEPIAAELFAPVHGTGAAELHPGMLIPGWLIPSLKAQMDANEMPFPLIKAGTQFVNEATGNTWTLKRPIYSASYRREDFETKDNSWIPLSIQEQIALRLKFMRAIQ